MKNIGYCQCSLRNRDAYQVAWIPQRYAQLHNVLKILTNGIWQDGWIVESVGAYADTPPDIGKAIRGHRDHTGDSLPKLK